MTEPEFLRTTRVFYDTVAVDYADHFRDAMDDRPLDRALLTAFAEQVRAAGDGPVADLGCGPGHVTAHLNALGVPAFGVDLSSRMVEVARRAYPGLRFDVGSISSLDLKDDSLAGVLAWYSIIHMPEERLPDVFAEFHRVLAPGGHLLVAFQVGDEPLHLARPWGHEVSLDFRRRRPDHVAGLLGQAGLAVRARLVREPEGPDTAPQAFLLARKPAGSAES
ncbi:class I SAM-dependent DNA methyltransferase [Planotetraspora kaengkrachanensis]|uniref:Methyltransferase n=1 Tax=Planotetraspora kaengkrachanensis TaxID=575193 RepID=A0A8J3PX41_9ACTN|nr:class I SAM-dependent methyltransferase [Planotetraspora kaengkrachanensis]GIG82582.1 methyltransferase [Planotetraspora kaengkrachanensis]